MAEKQKIKNNRPHMLCMVVRFHSNLGNVAPGERLTLPEAFAKEAERAGVVKFIAGPFLPQDVKDSGGMDAWLEKDAKRRLLPVEEEKATVGSYERQGYVPPAALPSDEQVV